MSQLVYALEPSSPPALAIRDVLDAAATVSWNQAVAGLLHSIREELSSTENCIATLKNKAGSEMDARQKREIHLQLRTHMAKTVLYQQSIQQIMALRRPSRTEDENQDFYRAVVLQRKRPQDTTFSCVEGMESIREASLFASAIKAVSAETVAGIDEPLVRLCRRFVELELQFRDEFQDNTDEGLEDGWDARDASAEFRSALSGIIATRAVSLAGIRAKAAAIWTYLFPEPELDAGIAWSILTDILSEDFMG